MEFDMKDHRVSLTHCTLKSRSDRSSSHLVTKLVTECSNDKTWTIVETRDTQDSKNAVRQQHSQKNVTVTSIDTLD